MFTGINPRSATPLYQQIVELVMRLLSYEGSERPRSAGDVLRELRGLALT